MDVPALIDSAIATSGQNGRRLMDKFEQTARKRGVLRDEQYEHSAMFSSLDYVVQCARLRDLVVAPVPDYIGLDELLIEDLVFGTGRPTVLLPAYEGAPTPEASIDRIAVAWDFSRAATRTLADALPLLQKAKKVFLFTVRGEKDIASTCSLNDVDRHLQTHGILAEIEDIPADSRPIGVVMREYVSQRKADMLVMGAFGHSRLREFVLGGASRDMIDRPPLPVFMSH
jgi:nucleotide-binding universal stress UspA family protein